MTQDLKTADQTGDQEITLLGIVQLLVRRKLLIGAICTLAALGSAGYSLTLTNIYSATAKVLPPQKETGGISSLLSQAGGLASLAAAGLGGGMDLYIGLLKSRSVSDAVIQRLNLTRVYRSQTMEATRAQLAQAVKVQGGTDGIIVITAEDSDPKLSAQLANAFVQELGVITVRLNLSKAGTERLFLEKRLEVVKRDLQLAENELKQFAQQNSIVQMDAQSKASIEGMARLKAEIASKEVELSALRSYQTEESPEVKAHLAGLKRLRSEYASMAGSGGASDAIPALGKVPNLGLAYARKMRDLKAQEAIFEQLTKQYEVAKLNAAKDSSSVQVLDEAVVPVQKNRPKRSRIVLLAVAAAFFFSIGVVFVLEHLEKLPPEERRIIDDIRRRALSWR